MKQYRIAVLAGDGIGPEVTGEAKKCLNAAADVFGFSLEWRDLPFGADYYLKHGVALPQSAFDDIAENDVMLLGAIGHPKVPPGPLEHGILLALRFHFDQFVNLRPARSFPGLPVPVPLPEGRHMDAVIVRENTEDMYMGIGGSGKGGYTTPIAARRGLFSLSGSVDLKLPPETESAFSLGLMTAAGIGRVARYAYDLAGQRGEQKVTVVSKGNAVPHLYGLWDRVTRNIAEGEYAGLTYASVNVDAMCYLLARNPLDWGVVLCPNLFGDIISDLMSALAGGLGLAAAGNIGKGLSMFEPVHGSAPTIAGTGKANPLAAIMSGVMLLRHVGENEAAAAVDRAVTEYVASDLPKPVEQGGTALTAQVGDLVRERIK